MLKTGLRGFWRVSRAGWHSEEKKGQVDYRVSSGDSGLLPILRDPGEVTGYIWIMGAPALKFIAH